MNETQHPLLSVDVSDGSHHRFYSLDEIGNWLSHERAELSWFFEGAPQAGGAISDLRNNYQNNFNHLDQTLSKWRNEPESTQRMQQFYNAFTSAYSSSTTVRSDHPFARIAADISKNAGPAAAAAAFGTLLGIGCTLNFETAKGIIAAVLKQSGIDPQSPNIVSKAIEDLSSSAAADRVRTNAEWDGIAQRAENLLRTTDESFKNQTEKAENDTAEAIGRLQDSVAESIQSIHTTEATYKEQMKLRAPVEYWQEKGRRHADALQKSRRNLIWFAAVGSAALVGSLYVLTTIALDASSKSAADTVIFLKFAAIGAVVTTILFWAGRVLLRIYMSDRHLLSDAEERVAMVMTYLALTNDGKVEASDRALVLAPLFRTASDGIVKDDGPDASLTGVVAKILDLKPGR
ncbi:ElaB/YqjD/DUF883 family membrane-anchored ribosome-binding protein [Bradyrhizobium huanghuaihaiense]|uniref:DUF6161 domain-containing protein n=1 Tax=Bradyrhizobium huanghuaihaiense TaxID=990078 RepID=A0A562RP53_9BRAD|nr:DUF6161 domain-containing protein [Bradyrhizobium huanghuaihaiense]TWI70822.1 hypothetical protein IQ16_03233 [Bradyrhizobium huanghuaihaiense]